MRSVILCEGSTDFVLLQYYMRKVHGWEYKKNDNVLIKGYKARKCVLKNIPWEDYTSIQKSFEKLGELSEQKESC